VSVHVSPEGLRLAACKLRHCARDLCCEINVYLLRGASVADVEHLLEITIGAQHDALEMEATAKREEAASCRV
jgi:hypothetical protein